MADYQYSVGSDLYDAGRHPEDGVPMVGEVLFLVAEDDHGRRWRGPGVSLHFMCDDDEEFGPVLVRRTGVEGIEAQIEAQAASMSGPPPETWYEIEPAYGSPYWDEVAIEFEGRDRF